jgi:hypothetical protein
LEECYAQADFQRLDNGRLAYSRKEKRLKAALGKCARCGKPSRIQSIHHVVDGRWTMVKFQSCDNCYRALREADAKAWKWFRDYLRRISK